jgi:hypothetical protein
MLNNGISVSEFIQEINETRYTYVFYGFIIKEKPIDNKTHKFKITLEKVNGTILTAETQEITWN